MLAILTTHPIQYQVPLWQALARDGRIPFEVWYLTDHGTQISSDREFGKTFAWDINTLEGYPYRFLKTASGSTPGSFWKCRLVEPLADLLRSSGVEALWIQGWQVAAYWQAVWQAHGAGIPVWLRGESNDLAPTSPWKKPLKRVALKEFFSRINEFLYIGTANRRLYEKYGVPASRLHLASYAVDNDRFGRQAEVLRPCRGELRKRWGVAEDAFCVLFCGKFIPKKRPLDIVAAARQLKASGQMLNVHLLFVGSGELGDELRRECLVVYDAEKGGLLQNTAVDGSQLPPASFAGFLNQTEISQAYIAGDCLALPSDHRETWGLVVNEALASGLQCIVSDACGCAEDLSRSCGVGVFRLGDSSGLADALRNSASSLVSTLPPNTLLQDYSLQQTLRTVAKLFPALR